MSETQRVLDALSTLRPPALQDEYNLQALIANALSAHGILFEKEARLAPRCRVDFLCAESLAIEVKRGRPDPTALREQLNRYAACAQVSGILLVVERNAYLPAKMQGKPVTVFGLNRLWGVAL